MALFDILKDTAKKTVSNLVGPAVSTLATGLSNLVKPQVQTVRDPVNIPSKITTSTAPVIQNYQTKPAEVVKANPSGVVTQTPATQSSRVTTASAGTTNVSPNTQTTVYDKNGKARQIDSSLLQSFLKQGFTQGTPQAPITPTAPVAPTPPVSSTEEKIVPETVSSADAEDYMAKYDEQTQKLADTLAERQAEAQAQVEAMRNPKRGTLSKQQGEEENTQNVLEYRLGRKDTLFGQGEIQNLKTEHTQELADFDAETQSLVAAAKTAMEEGDRKQYGQLLEEAKAREEFRKNRVDEQRQQVQDAMTTAKAGVEQKLNQDKFDLDVKKYQSDIAEKSKPLVVSPGSSLYDPETMEYLGTAPKPADDKAPQLETWGGQVHQWNPSSNSWESIGSEKDVGGGNSNNVSAANLIASGKAKLTDYAAEDRGAISGILEKMPPKTEDVTSTQSKVDQLNGLLSHPGLNSSVGPNVLARIPLGDAFGAKQDFIGQVQKLLSQRTLQTLIDAKANGATFGALSEGELKILQSASTAIGTWEHKDKNGNVDGYNVSEKAFKEEITKIKDEYENLLKNTAGQNVATNTAQKAVDDYYVKNPNVREKIDLMSQTVNPETGQYYTDQEQADILGLSFNKVGGDTNTATKIALSIPDNVKGGQCGHFVNQITGLGLGDSYRSKMAKMDPSIQYPESGMVFVMPVQGSAYGHTGFIVDVQNGVATVKDSNWFDKSSPETIKTHKIPVSQMTGFTYT
jgi:hypothetical protein